MRTFEIDKGELTPGRGAGRLAFAVLAGLTIATYIAFAVVAGMNTHNRIGLGSTPLFYDFSVFHQAAVLANTSHAADAYDDGKMIAAEHAAFPGSRMRLPWNYPPTFQFMLMPLGALPYVAAWLVWSCTLYALYALLARHLVDEPRQLCFLLLAPGVAINLFFGQNGILSVLILGAGTLLLGSRPILGGILLGMMAYKPQFALLVPLVLVFGREWRALGAAIVSQTTLILLSAIVLGMGPWHAFLHRIMQPSTVFSSSSSDWRGIPSIMIFLRTLGLGTQASTIGHLAIAAVATALAVWTWRKTSDGQFRLAVLATATVLVTPYLRGYDLALLVLPVAVLLSLTKLTVIEYVVVFGAWLLPALLMFSSTRIQFGPLVSLALLTVVYRRIPTEWPARKGPNVTEAPTA